MREPSVFEKTSVKLALGIALIVVVPLGVGIYIFTKHFYKTQIQALRDASAKQNRLMRLALEYGMLENDQSLIQQMVHTFAYAPNVDRVFIVDHDGKVRFTSDPNLEDRVFKRDSEACWPCHMEKPRERSRFIVMQPESRPVLRSVEPIVNREVCHQCHPADQKINGVLVMDVPVGAFQESIERDAAWMSLGASLLAVVLLVGTGLLMRMLVFKRLAQLADTARSIAGGDLSRRVRLKGSDRISELGEEFNLMADSVERLIADVRRHQARIENVMNSVDDGLVVLDRELRIVAANDAFVRRAGIHRRELVRRRCYEVLPDAHVCSAGKEPCPSKKCFESGRLEKGIFYFPKSEDRERIEEVHASPLFGEGQRVEQVVEVWRDITERRREEARLAEFHRLASVGMLASGFSHEMNTPLASMLMCIDGIIDLIREPRPLQEAGRMEIREQAEIIRKEILRCKQVTSRFMNFAMRKDLRIDLVQVGSVIEAVVPLAASTARALKVELVVEGSDWPAVSANEGGLQQVLLNLLLNAIQVSEPGGRVTLDCLTGREEVRIRIRDEGCGIPEEDLDRIFEPFFTKRPGGTGLGLFLSRIIVKMWGGDIQVQSTPGKGSCFEIVCPLPME